MTRRLSMPSHDLPIALLASDLNTGLGAGRLALVAVTGGPLTAQVRSLGVRTLTLDEDGGPLPEVRSSERLLADDRVIRQLGEWGIRSVIPFKTSVKLERVARGAGITILAPPAATARRLENKLELPALAEAAGVRAPRTWKISVHDQGYRLAGSADEPVFPAVLQRSVGFAGHGTVPVASEVAAHAAAARASTQGRSGDLAKLTEFIVGSPLTVNGCALADGTVLIGGVCRQLTGVPELSPEPLASCGNDWTTELDSELVRAARLAAWRVGTAAARGGLIGFFGVDLVATSGGEVVLIELNPRWTAGLSFSLSVQAQDSGPTLLDALPAAFDGLSGDTARAQDARDRFHVESAPAAVQPSEPSASIMVYSTAEADFTPQPYRGQLDLGALEASFVRGTGWMRAQRIVLPRPSSAPVAPGDSLGRVLVGGRTVGSTDGRTIASDVATFVSELRSTLVDAPR